jgi:putative peptide maturation dehydrogenase
MRLRRCFALMIEPRERSEFDMSGLLAGGSGIVQIIEWIALAAHLDSEAAISDQEAIALSAFSAERWIEPSELAAKISKDTTESLVRKGLLIADEGGDDDARRRDQTLRDTHWRAIDAIVHRFSRWQKVDTVDAQRRFAEETDQTFLERLGPAPPLIREWTSKDRRLSLPRSTDGALDALLSRRVTCRNYDTSRALSAADFGQILFATFGARAVDEYAPDVFLLKRGVPSAGGLHPTEAYVIVQRVEGLAPGLYHYHPADHALEPIREMSTDEIAAFALRALGGQPYFADAHAMIAMTSRFGRNFWKYRNHAKAYRATILDIGHLSQTLYLAATELGLGAFITAGINEVDIEQAFGLDPMAEGPLAMCGFGIRGNERREVEFDPLHAVWPAESKRD